MSEAVPIIETSSPTTQSKTCPALLVARLIDADARQHDDFEVREFRSKDDFDRKAAFRDGGKMAGHYRDSRLRALVLTR